MMKTICIAGLKGGIGKTTTTTTLAYLLQAEKEKRVLLIDADCQANATMTYDVEARRMCSGKFVPSAIQRREILTSQFILTQQLIRKYRMEKQQEQRSG